MQLYDKLLPHFHRNDGTVAENKNDINCPWKYYVRDTIYKNKISPKITSDFNKTFTWVMHMREQHLLF